MTSSLRLQALPWVLCISCLYSKLGVSHVMQTRSMHLSVGSVRRYTIHWQFMPQLLSARGLVH